MEKYFSPCASHKSIRDSESNTDTQRHSVTLLNNNTLTPSQPNTPTNNLKAWNSNKNANRKFNASWKQGRSWLQYSPDQGMTCADCIAANKGGTFVTGTHNLHLQTITTHETSNNHTGMTLFLRYNVPFIVFINFMCILICIS